MLILKNITKTYPGVVALNKVSFSVKDGEVHALLGENGAGKSTMIKIIAGAVEPDSGSICFDEKEYHKMTPQLSQENGVAVIYQELNLCAPLTVAENIFLGRPQAQLYSQRQVNALAQEIFDEYGFDLKPNVPVAALPPAKQQLVEICKAISMGAKQEIYNLMNEMAAEGKAIIMISSDMEEILGMSDRILVLSEGRVAGELQKANFSQENVLTLASGLEVNV